MSPLKPCRRPDPTHLRWIPLVLSLLSAAVLIVPMVANAPQGLAGPLAGLPGPPPRGAGAPHPSGSPSPISPSPLIAQASAPWRAAHSGTSSAAATPQSPSPAASAVAGWWNLTTHAGGSPPLAADFNMVYDAHDGYVLEFGGQNGFNSNSNQTWAFSGGHWRMLHPSTYPSAREGVFMAYDPVSARVVLFGGVSVSPNQMVHDDTWEFHAGTWTNVTSSVTGAPSARSIGSFAYSPSDSGLILFGGANLVSSLNETWKLAGHAWTRVTTTTAPSPRDYATMIYDPNSGYIVLFGGADITTGKPVANQETWKFSGGTWTMLSPGIVPSKRYYSSMEYDSIDGYVILYGGLGTTAPLGDTWRFSGGLWSQLAPAATPPASYFDAMACDAADGYVVMLTGNVQTGSALVTRNDTWAYAPALASHPRAVSSSFDLGATAQFIGNGSGGIGPYAYFWEFGDAATGTGAAPSHPYGRAGTFVANLTVRDAIGTLANASVTIVVNPPPSARASASSATTDSGLNVTFTCRVTGGTAPFSYAWKFGDGGTASGSNTTTHPFASPEAYHVLCTVTDAGGATANSTQNETVHPLPTVEVSPTAPSTTPGAAISFVGAVSAGTPPYSFHWDFGDGSTAATQNVSKGYDASGAFTVTLTVTDAAGGVGRATAHVAVNAAASGVPTYLWVGIVLIAVVAVAAAALVFRSRRKSGGDPSSTEMRKSGGDPSSTEMRKAGGDPSSVSDTPASTGNSLGPPPPP